MCSPASTGESVGLFMLRKDSERRATLHRVLTDYISLVVFNIQDSVPQVSEEKQRRHNEIQSCSFKTPFYLCVLLSVSSELFFFD